MRLVVAESADARHPMFASVQRVLFLRRVGPPVAPARLKFVCKWTPIPPWWLKLLPACVMDVSVCT